MRSLLRSRPVALGSIALLAVVLAISVGVYRAAAARGINNDFFVSITSPVDEGNLLELTAYTPSAEVPPRIPIGVNTVVSETAFRGAPVLDSVRTVLGGDVDEPNARITDELQSVEATLINDAAIDDYFAVVNASLLDYESVSTRGTLPSLFASDFIRSVAIVDAYYSSARTVSNIGGISEIGIDVNIRNLAEVDSDGNLLPDATALLQPELLLMDSDGNVTLVISLGDPVVRGASSIVDFDFSFETASGPISVEGEVPSLATMQAAAGGALDAFDTARLIVGLSEDPVNLLDGPIGVDPLGEFDLDAPEPQNLFARVNVAFTTVGTRGVIPTWSFAGADVLSGGLLPSGLELELVLSGPGIAALLDDGVDVAAYTYETTMSQVDEDLFADGDEEGWVEGDGVILSNEDNADDDDDARVVVASAGDDTITVASRNISAIYGSNAVPSLRTSGGGTGGICFIATAAYGTPMSTEIGALRGVRDRYMLTNPFGAAFADTYYRFSPPVAGQVAQSEGLRRVVRTALWPAVAVSKWILISPISALAAMMGLVAVVSAALLRRRRA